MTTIMESSYGIFQSTKVDILPSPSMLSLCCLKNIKDVDVVSVHEISTLIGYLAK